MTVAKEVRKVHAALQGVAADLEAELDLASSEQERTVLEQGKQDIEQVVNELQEQLARLEREEPEYRRDR